MGRLDGKVAIVTGGARGQGEAAARLFVAEGAVVVIGDVLEDAGRQVAAELAGNALFKTLDVRSETSWQELVDAAERRYGSVTVLVNNAGIVREGGVADQSLEDYVEVVMVNQIGCFLGMKSVVPSMMRAGSGSIVNISSTSGLLGYPNYISYVASKFAIRGMTKAAAVELGSQGIRVNAVFPGPVKTAFLNPANPNEIPTDFNPPPLGRAADVIELARLSLFLASDDSSYCTGAEFVADGGRTAGPKP